MPDIDLRHGDCIDVLRELPDASVDACVTDPPYLLGFMGRAWDTRAAHEHLDWHRAWCDEAFRVLKPGGHMLAFGGTRTFHRLACAIEDAGFEIRDSIAWLYASGFPKSLDVSKAISGTPAERAAAFLADLPEFDGTIEEALADANEQAKASMAAKWSGWGTALKPAFEPVVVARKPLAGTVAANVLAHGTGALNIDGCRVGSDGGTSGGRGGGIHHYDGFSTLAELREAAALGNKCPRGQDARATLARVEARAAEANVIATGRWPANVVLDGPMAEALDEQSGELTSNPGTYREDKPTGDNGWGMRTREGHVTSNGDSGGASRFFYVAKADASERVRVNGTAHPTVKPLALMRWLVRLVTPPGGTVLEPFAGSGTTVEACLLEGFDCIAIEREADYLPLIRQRINRRRNPVEAIRGAGEDGGLFDLLGEDTA